MRQRHINESSAPYSKLPFELIEKILRLCVSRPRPLSLSSTKKHQRLRITQICAFWRKVAFGIDDIWDVHLKELPTASTLNLISAWFRQCSSEKISFTMPNSLRMPPIEWSAPMIDAVIPYASRFRSLRSLILGMDQLESIPFDALTDLSIRFFKVSKGSPQRIVAPSLQTFEVTDINHHFLGSNILLHLPQVPWVQLTSVTLTGGLGFGEVHKVLMNCLSLIHCRLHHVQWAARGTLTPGSLRLPYLKKLEIKFSSPQLFHQLFVFDIPHIVSLSINLPHYTEEAISAFIQFMTKNKRSLRKFGISTTAFCTDTLLETILGTVPLITHLHASKQRISQNVLSIIGTGELLPDLEVLEFKVSAGTHMEDVLNLLKPSKRTRPSRLQTVRMYAVPTSRYAVPIGDLHIHGVHISVI